MISENKKLIANNKRKTNRELSRQSNNKEDDDEESFHSADESEVEDVVMSAPATSESDVITASYYKFQIDLKRMQVLLVDNKEAFKQFKYSLNNESQTSKIENSLCSILTPLDLFFNIHQCVYTDDIKLPAWKVFGRVPLISTELSNKKLEQIIRLVKSIPLPTNTTKITGLSETANIIYDEPMNQESEILIDSLDILHKGKVKTTDSTTSSSLKMSTSTNLKPTETQISQAINLELSFEINEIYIKLIEELPQTEREAAKIKYFDWISFKISSFGTFVQMKTYDTNVNIYLNYAECEYGLLNDVDNSRLYLISSANRVHKPLAKTLANQNQANLRTRRLIDIEIIQTDSQSPTLNTMHENILTKIDVQVCSIDFVLNLVALRNLLTFIK